MLDLEVAQVCIFLILSCDSMGTSVDRFTVSSVYFEPTSLPRGASHVLGINLPPVYMKTLFTFLEVHCILYMSDLSIAMLCDALTSGY